jgi:hypothetical protein
LFPGKERISVQCELFALVNGEFVSVRSFSFDRSNNAVNVGPDVYGQVSIAINGIQSDVFRLVCKKEGGRWNAKSGFSEIVISEAPVLEYFVEKKLGKMFPSPLPAWNSYIWEDQESIAHEDLKINGEKVIDISDKMDTDGLAFVGCSRWRMDGNSFWNDAHRNNQFAFSTAGKRFRN